MSFATSRILSTWRCFGSGVALACLSGALLAACFPKAGVAVVAWVGLVPLLVALEGAKPLQAFTYAYLAGWVMFTGIFSWIWALPSFQVLDYVLLAIYLACYGGVFGLTLACVRRRTSVPLGILAPSIWVSLEYVRGHAGFLGFPWMLLGHSQYQHPALLQISSVTGAYGVSFLIVLVNAALAELIMMRPSLSFQSLRGWSAGRIRSAPRSAGASLLLPLALLVLCGLYGVFRLHFSQEGEVLRVSVVQGNIPQDRKWDAAWRDSIIERHLALTRRAALDHPSLIVWPETSVAGDVQHSPPLRDRVAGVAHETQSYLLVGNAEAAKFSSKALSGKSFNSMVLFSPDGLVLGEYRKILLLPFGEYVPLRETVPWPDNIAVIRKDIVAGREPTLFMIGSTAFGATICWENVFPDLFREFVKRGAQFMVNATNEAWFGETGASEQFLAISVFRAVENRVAIARAANTGVSAFIDPYGRITSRLTREDGKDVFVEGTLTHDIPLSTERTFYTLYGDVFLLVQLLVCAVVVLRGWLVTGARRPVPSLVTAMKGDEG